jgi:predicted DNA-binding protein
MKVVWSSGSIAFVPKLTFSLDDETVTALRQMAQRRRKPQSLIVREAIARYAEGEDVLSDRDRERLLRVLRRIRTGPATRSQADVDRELQAIRRSRRTGWTRSR